MRWETRPLAENMRGPLVATVRRELAAARAEVRTALAAAAAAHAEAVAQRSAALERTPQRQVSLVSERDAALAGAADRWRQETSTIADAVRALARSAAPGAAGLSWPKWQPSPSPTPAGLLRIGSLDYEPPLPALVPLLDVSHLELSGPDSSTLDDLITGLLLRMLGCVPAGGVRLWIYDPSRLGRALSGFGPLALPDIVRYIGPGGLTETLDDLAGQIERITTTVLSNEYLSVAEAAAALGHRPEPWRVLVLLADRDSDLPSVQRTQLNRITRTGVAAGVHVIARGITLEPHDTVQSVAVVAGSAAATSLTGELAVLLDPPPPADLVSWYAKGLAAGPPPATMDSLMPSRIWAESSVTELRAPIGESTDGELIELVLDDHSPHAFIGGPSASGKTNLLCCWLAGLAARYSPDELQVHLLDVHEGLAPALEPGWLPHVRLVGVNADREFGLALLRHLTEEMRRRIRAAEDHGATTLTELRAADPEGHWPRIAACLDEFEATPESVALLENLAAGGRPAGIHLVLVGQDMSGIEAMAAHVPLRVALPKAQHTLAETNLAAELIPRHHAVVNFDSGGADANLVVRLPDASDRTRWQALQAQLFSVCDPAWEPPRVFDGYAVPAFPELPESPPDFAKEGAVALLGETLGVHGRPATVRLTRSPGRNLAVLGTRTAEASAILAAAGRALARQHAPGDADFFVACLDPDAAGYAKALAAELPGSTWYDSSSFVDLLTAVVDTERVSYLFCYAVDAAYSALAAERGPSEPTGHELLRSLLSTGPQRRTHTLAWWRSVARLSDDLGGDLDSIGAWVALDVQGPDLAALSTEPGGPVWYPRPLRGLYFDRAADRAPEILIPYEADL
jgi:DNA segregation ATPase FtsK/SpoIIIE, S-DNA-T family